MNSCRKNGKEKERKGGTSALDLDQCLMLEIFCRSYLFMHLAYECLREQSIKMFPFKYIRYGDGTQVCR